MPNIPDFVSTSDIETARPSAKCGSRPSASVRPSSLRNCFRHRHSISEDGFAFREKGGAHSERGRGGDSRLSSIPHSLRLSVRRRRSVLGSRRPTRVQRDPTPPPQRAPLAPPLGLSIAKYRASHVAESALTKHERSSMGGRGGGGGGGGSLLPLLFTRRKEGRKEGRAPSGTST